LAAEKQGAAGDFRDDPRARRYTHLNRRQICPKHNFKIAAAIIAAVTVSRINKPGRSRPHSKTWVFKKKEQSMNTPYTSVPPSVEQKSKRRKNFDAFRGNKTAPAATPPKGASHPVLLTEAQAAEILGLSPTTLNNWRWQRIGPPYLLLSARCVRYDKAKLEEWIEQQTIYPLPRQPTEDDDDL
jgi:predicted DNA-binding transcriptional regulator AlpA